MARILAIEGSIGAGKSTLLEILKLRMVSIPNLIFVKEPVEEWFRFADADGKSIFEHYYSNQKEYGFAFQVLALSTRYKLLKDICSANPEKTIICERSLQSSFEVFSKLLYELGHIGEQT